ncbi:MAG: GNAT family N-acetyltransferase [Niastella sp.]|nr:GNAT family N-acetyltransferase [Niastella sp.]
MIQLSPYSQLPDDVRQLLNDYIHAEFGHIPIVQETAWASPDWTILYKEGDTIVSFYNIIERYILMDGKSCKVAGINNVITPAAFRGQGYCTKLLNDTTSFIFDELRTDYALLLCADAMIPFYQRLGWYTVDSEVYFDQPSGRKRWAANIMLLSLHKPVAPATIDLQGTPW